MIKKNVFMPNFVSTFPLQYCMDNDICYNGHLTHPITGTCIVIYNSQ